MSKQTETITGTITALAAHDRLVGWNSITIDGIEARIADATLAEAHRAKGSFLQVGDTMTATVVISSHATTGETIRRVTELS